MKWNMPIYQTLGFASQPILFGGIALFAMVLLIYSFDFLIDVKYWETKAIGHFNIFKLLAKIWIAISFSILLGLMIFMVVRDQAKILLAGQEILGYLNLQVALIVVLTGIYGLLKIAKWKISGFFFVFIIALVSALSITIPIYLLSNQTNFRILSDLIQPLTGFLGLFLMNLIVVSYFEKEKDTEGNTLNIWNTNPNLSLVLLYAIPIFSMVAYWLFKWNATMHSQFFVMGIYLLMYYFPKAFRIVSSYRIIVDVALLLIFLKVKW